MNPRSNEPPSDKILRFSEDVFSIKDGAKAEAIVLALGILNQMLAQPPSPTGRGSQVFPVVFHPTHWLLVARHYGHAKKEDNGFEVIGWAKSNFSEVEFSLQADEIAAFILGASSGVIVTMIDTEPLS